MKWLETTSLLHNASHFVAIGFRRLLLTGPLVTDTKYSIVSSARLMRGEGSISLVDCYTLYFSPLRLRLP